MGLVDPSLKVHDICDIKFSGQPSDRSVDSITRPASGQLIVRRVSTYWWYRISHNIWGSLGNFKIQTPHLGAFIPGLEGPGTGHNIWSYMTLGVTLGHDDGKRKIHSTETLFSPCVCVWVLHTTACNFNNVNDGLFGDICTTQDYGSKEYTSLDRVCSDTNISMALDSLVTAR